MKRIALGLLIVAGLGLRTTFAQDEVPVIPGQPQKITIIQNESGEQFRNIQLFQPEVLAESANAGAYYIGLDCEPIPLLYRKQLKLGNDAGGLLITDVLKDSPADKVKLKAGDLLLKVNDHAINSIKDLVEKVQANKAEAMSVKIRRDGEDQTIEVKPEKRPEPVRGGTLTLNGSPLTPQEAQAKWFDQLRKQGFHIQMPAAGTFDVVRPAPGIVMRAPEMPGLPDNTSVSIKREGLKPAQIEIKQGDKTYTTTSDKLDDLPAEIRKLVEPMINGTGSVMGVQGSTATGIHPGQVIEFVPGHAVHAPPLPQIRIQQLPNLPAVPATPNLEQQMQEMQKQLQNIQKQLQELRK